MTTNPTNRPDMFRCPICRTFVERDKMLFDPNGYTRYCKKCWRTYKQGGGLTIRERRNRIILEDLRRNGIC